METILVLAYTIWSFYSGYRFLSGRSEWLDRQAPLNIIIKMILSLMSGYVIAAFYLVYLMLKVIGIVLKL